MASYRAIDGVDGALDVTASAPTVRAIESSPLVSTVSPVSIAYETSATAGWDSGDRAVTGDAGTAQGKALAASGVTAWQEAGYRGDGVTVAVIDTGFARWQESEAQGLVPAVAAGDDIDHCDAGFAARPHGTATSSVVYAAAPEARLVRVCIDDSMDLATAVTELIARGDIDIVNMALGFYNTGPGDGRGGPGSPDDSVRRALAAGLVWVNSAGNEAPLHYTGRFTDVDGDLIGEYIDPSNPGAAGDEYGRFTVPAGADVELFLRWDEWGETPPADAFRLCFSITDGGPLNCLDAAQPDRGVPATGVALTNSRDDAVTFYVAIRRIRGAGSPTLDLFFTEAEGWEHPVAASSLVEPAAVPGVVAVGAACSDTGLVQPVSSQGPTRDGRPGISLVASGAGVDGLFGSAADCQGGFGGTSAAAPHVSGALALLRQADPLATGPDLVERLLRSTALRSDPGAPGVDPVYGHGLLALGDAPPYGPGETSSTLTFAVAGHSDRRDAVALAGQPLSGGPFIWLTPLHPDPVPSRVEFYIDDTLVNIEVWPTLDVAGGFEDQSFPVDTTRLANGRHRLAAVISWPDGSREIARGDLVVANAGTEAAPLGTIVRADGTPLDRSTVAADEVVSLQVADPSGIAIHHVNFFVDAVQVGEDGSAPYEADLASLPDLAAGQHVIRAIAIRVDGTLWAVDANFTTT